GQQPGAGSFHRTGRHPLRDLGRDCDPGLDALELWLDGEMGLWETRNRTTLRAEIRELPVDQQSVVGSAGTDHHLHGGTAGDPLPDLEPVLTVCDDGAALSAGRQM